MLNFFRKVVVTFNEAAIVNTLFARGHQQNKVKVTRRGNQAFRKNKKLLHGRAPAVLTAVYRFTGNRIANKLMHFDTC